MSNSDHVENAIHLLFEPDSVVELRIPKAGKSGTVSGYFDDFGALATAIQEWSGAEGVEAVYFTLNPVNPILLSRATNRVKRFAQLTTSDSDILKRRWLLLDFDPVRPSGISSSDVEKQAAREKARAVRGYLRELQWPEPLAADSGNGYHLLYRIDLPNDPPSTELVKRILVTLATKFNDDIVKIDTSVFNAARICKAYGSVAAKGDSTNDRPHRLAHILRFASTTVVPVTVDQLRAIAAELPRSNDGFEYTKSRAGTAQINAAQVEEFLADYEIKHRSAAEYQGGSKWILNSCPFNSDHSGTSVAVFLSKDGVLGFECRHSSCQHNTWKEFRSRLEELNPGKEFSFRNNDDARPRARLPEFAAPSASATWNELANELDVIRVGIDQNTENKKPARIPRHLVQEQIFQFVVSAFRERGKFFFDAYPYIYVPAEEGIIKFHDENEAYFLLSRLRLRAEQPDAKFVRANLRLHITKTGEPTQVEKFGCWRGEYIYVNNGRGGMFKISESQILEVPNGTDGVLMLAPEVLPWPELDADSAARVESVGKRLGKYGLHLGDTPLCRHLNALFDPQKLTSEQYHQLFLSRFLALFLVGPHLKLRPIQMALGEQNSGKSTLFEKIMWLIVGLDYESEALPQDTRSFLAAVTNHHVKIFDNVDGADFEKLGFVDFMYKCATGGNIPIAQLYETNVERIFNLRCDLMFTARYNPWPSTRSDLSRRTLFFPIRRPAESEYKTVERIQEQLWANRDEILVEVLVRLQLVLRGLLANADKDYPPVSEMHSYETYTMRVADYEGWAEEMKAIWQGYYGDYQERVVEYSPLTDLVRKWLGYPKDCNNPAYPNVGRWVKVGQLFKELKVRFGSDLTDTWKNESTLGRALERNFSALRVLGVEKKRVGGSKCYRFTPDEQQFELCKQAWSESGLWCDSPVSSIEEIT